MVYFTCDVCGRSAKGYWPCDCPENETLKNMKLRVGCRILDCYHYNDGVNEYLYEKLETLQNEVIFMKICLGGGEEEHEDYWKLVLISQMSFDDHDHRIKKLQPYYLNYVARAILDNNDHNSDYCEEDSDCDDRSLPCGKTWAELDQELIDYHKNQWCGKTWAEFDREEIANHNGCTWCNNLPPVSYDLDG